MEQNVDTGTPVMPVIDDKQKGGNGLKIATAIACVMAVFGIGFGVYGIIEANNKSSEISNLKIQIEDKDGKITTLGTDEIKISDDSQTITISDSNSAYAIRDLKSKTLRLLGSRNGLSMRDYYNDNTGGFIVLSGYMPTAQLITNSLDEVSRAYITLETTLLDKEKHCNYQWTDGVKADVDAALGEKASNISFGNANIDCISYDKANDDHYDLWGENMPKVNGVSNTLTNGDFAYGSNTDVYYYHIIGGRGGTCSSYVVGRIAQVDMAQDSAYIDIGAGSFDTCADNAGKLYTDIEKGELYRTFEQDNINWDGLGLTEDDYKSLQSYRFVFKKNQDGIYSFSTIEKL